MMQPVISVIMPVFNCGIFVGEAIESILGQSFTGFELLIIDDGSTDRTYAVASSYTDPRIRLIQKKENTGLVASLNLGIASARGEFLARMDGDDISDPERFRHQLDFLYANPDVMLCGSWYRLWPSEEIVKLPTDPGSVKIALLENCAMGHPTMMMRRAFITEHQLFYDEAFKAAEDYDLWTRTAALGKMANIPLCLLSYRIHPGQVTANEQYHQVKNSNLCRIRMLCYPLAAPSAADMKISEQIVTNAKLASDHELRSVLSWLSRLAESNARSLFFHVEKFGHFISDKKRQFVRRYYLHHTRYSPAVLRQFLRPNEFRQYFTLQELLKFYLKCLLFWK